MDKIYHHHKRIHLFIPLKLINAQRLILFDKTVQSAHRYIFMYLLIISRMIQNLPLPHQETELTASSKDSTTASCKESVTVQIMVNTATKLTSLTRGAIIFGKQNGSPGQIKRILINAYQPEMQCCLQCKHLSSWLNLGSLPILLWN